MYSDQGKADTIACDSNSRKSGLTSIFGVLLVVVVVWFVEFEREAKTVCRRVFRCFISLVSYSYMAHFHDKEVIGCRRF